MGNEIANVKSNPVHNLYLEREKFTVIGLTGLTGCGSSYMAKIAGKSAKELMADPSMRKAEDLICGYRGDESLDNSDLYFNGGEVINQHILGQMVFKRKFTICQKFFNENYTEFTVVKYTHALLLYILFYYRCRVEKCEKESMIEYLKSVIDGKYAPSIVETNDEKIKQYAETHPEIREVDYDVLGNGITPDLLSALDKFDLDRFKKQDHGEDVDKIAGFIDSQEKKDAKQCYEMFFNDAFNTFCDSFIKYLREKNLYYLCMFFQKVGFAIRLKGDPTYSIKKNEGKNTTETDYSHVIVVAKLINRIIKGYHYAKPEERRLIVIDAIRNSIEARFFKERYTAFYMVAVHAQSSESRKKHMIESIQAALYPNTAPDLNDDEREYVNLTYQHIKHLTDIEADDKSSSSGRFAEPDINRCVADAELHLINNDRDDSKYEFWTLTEQWMKYASLILHPGLITPSAEERCMGVAYMAKFNSMCLSRQVGAVITNREHSIRTIGWNDVPYGQIPCGLLELNELVKPSPVYERYRKLMFSAYQLDESEIEEECSFCTSVRSDYPDLEEQRKNLNGLPHSFCFKTLRNKFEGEKNQVHTRSLHAEENAMLQMVKYGGQPLKDGVIYVTASPCELCCKKLYQIGVRKIVYIDPYPGISRENIISNGLKRPTLKLFQGAYGATYYKLYQPFMSYKDEISIRTGGRTALKTQKDLLEKILDVLKQESKKIYSEKEVEVIVALIKDKIKPNA